MVLKLTYAISNKVKKTNKIKKTPILITWKIGPTEYWSVLLVRVSEFKIITLPHQSEYFPKCSTIPLTFQQKSKMKKMLNYWLVYVYLMFN